MTEGRGWKRSARTQDEEQSCRFRAVTIRPGKESRKTKRRLVFGCCGGEIGEKVRERVAGLLVVKMEMREHPGRDPFKILRFLVLIFFAA